MRSIRRSLTGYLFALLAVTLAVVWVVIDQVTARSLAAREEAATNLIRVHYEARCREEQARTDEVLLAQARELGINIQSYYLIQTETELAKSRASVGTVQLAFAPVPLVEAPSRKPRGCRSATIGFRGPRGRTRTRGDSGGCTLRTHRSPRK